MLLDRLLVTESVVTLGFRVFLRVGGVDAVHIGGLEHGLAFEFGRAQHGGGVGGEKRIAGAGGQQDDCGPCRDFSSRACGYRSRRPRSWPAPTACAPRAPRARWRPPAPGNSSPSPACPWCRRPAAARRARTLRRRGRCCRRRPRRRARRRAHAVAARSAASVSTVVWSMPKPSAPVSASPDNLTMTRR